MLRRSLILAGGGLKVAFQAGVLQVWLDEAGLRFDHVDGCSGGCFNLAMLCQGYSGTRIADAWRATRPTTGVSLRLRDALRFPYGRSLITIDGYRKRVFPRWGLDWPRVRASALDATFNFYDVTRQRLRVLGPEDMSEDALCACVSQALWFPTVRLGQSVCTDAVWVTDANVETAIERQADEIWIIWTISTRPDWLPGLLAQVFHTLEASTNGHLRRALDRIEANNADIAAGRRGCYGRPITVRMLHAEVPVHYLVVLGADRLHRAVERGVAAARAWCDEQGIAHQPVARPDPYADGVALRFRDTMRGRLALASGPDPAREVPCAADLELRIPDAGSFVTSPVPCAEVTGTVCSPVLGGTATVRSGTARILVDENGDPTRKRFDYRLHLDSPGGRPFTLVGVKTVDSGDIRRLWSETTTLHTQLLHGHLAEGVAGVPVAAGSLRLGPLDVLRQATTARASGGTPAARARSLARFGLMFVGNLWDVYARKVLTYAPF